jgi:TatA/E family protein of Tat protein translocase
MFGVGAQELIIILVIALIVFGPKRLPELARSLGRGLAEFRRASSDLRSTLSTDATDEAAAKPTKPALTTADASVPAQSVGEPEAQPDSAPASPAPTAATNANRG